MINKIVCWWKGHKRGKRIDALENGTTKRFACPRCGRVTEYKAKAAA